MGKNSYGKKSKSKSNVVKFSSLHVDYDSDFEETVLKRCKSSHAIVVRKDNRREKRVEALHTKDKGKKIENASAMQQNIAIKPKKRKRASTEEVQFDKLPVKKWDYYVALDAKLSCSHWSSHTNIGVVDELKLKLTDEQIQMFRKTCFGYFLDLPPVVVQNQVIRFLMSRELVQDSEDEFYVKINHSTLCFGIREFAIISGLRCVGEVNDEGTYSGSNRLKEAYFPDRDRVSKDDLIDCFMEKRWQSDNDALKISLLYFIYTFLFFTISKRSFVSNRDFFLIESGEYEQFPWGKIVFKALIGSVRNKFRFVKKFHRFGGLPLALHIWIYECCSEVDPNIATRVASRVPRILNWNVTKRPSFEKLCNGMLGESRNKLVFTNISATVDELGALYLPINVEFAAQKGVVSEDVCQLSVNESGYITPPFKRSNKQQLRNINSNASNDESFLEGKYSISDFEKLRREYESFKKFVIESFEKVFNGNILAHNYDQRPDENVENDFEKLNKDFCLFKEYVMDSFAKLFDENKNLHNRFTEKSDAKSDGIADKQGNVDIDSPNNNHDHVTDEVIHVHETTQMNIISQVNQGDTNVLHDRLESVAEYRKNLPTFDGGDYPIPSESQIAILEQTAVQKAVEVVNETNAKTIHKRDCSSATLVPKQYFNLKHPFTIDIGVEPDIALRWAFEQFVDTGTYKKPNVGAIYKKGKDLIEPYVFRDHHIVKKEWFHTLNYSGQPLDDTHIDVIFYYLRKKIKYDVNVPKSFTTTNFPFCVKVKSLYDQFLSSNRDYGVIPKDHEIADYMRGSRMPCNIPWHTVDHVLIPIGLKDE
ncbi:uncharacterized protein [Nicotiana sylvestris]|uniref:uncharacterized protein n=1 Tax=Nicotiana sylvestris TaxID=4096 RepID=UPI00388CB959